MEQAVTSPEPTRRDFIYIATGAAAAVAVGGAVWPFIHQMNPDASTIAAGAPVEVDLAPVAAGQIISVMWRGKPIFIRHLTAKEVEAEKNVAMTALKDPEPMDKRVKAGKEQWLVAIGICTHLGCVPIGQQGKFGGWFCPCHGSDYDALGRIRSGPAPLNLLLPDYAFLSDTRIRIG